MGSNTFEADVIRKRQYPRPRPSADGRQGSCWRHGGWVLLGLLKGWVVEFEESDRLGPDDIGARAPTWG